MNVHPIEASRFNMDVGNMNVDPIYLNVNVNMKVRTCSHAL